MKKPLLKIAALIVLSLSLAACSSLKNKDKTRGWSANKIYQEAKSNLHEGDYEEAIELYETLEARYPLGRFAQQAQLETAYAYYKFEEPDSALDAIDRYVRMNPRAKNIDYALYLRGLVNFTRGNSFVDRFLPRSIADLDNVRQKESFHDFSNLLTRYPNSKYAGEAQMRLQHLRNALAQSEVNVGKYYMQRGAYLAAFNRAEYTIKHYQNAPAVVDALVLKIKSARKLGKNDLANASLRVLQTNYPNRASKAIK